MAVNDVLGLVLGGGRGARLWPLTKERAKPAVPIAGKYRLVDISLSNCLNSGIHKISILTQFNSVSLHRHISRTYNFDAFHPGWVQILAAEQTFASEDWYQGTADAVRKQLFEIVVTKAEDVLILAGDHLYRMDYAPLAEFHWAKEADITVAVTAIHRDAVHRYGILKMGDDGRITSFIEKPTAAEASASFVSRDQPDRPYLGSMGIYLFKTPVLVEMLNSTLADFGRDVIPAAIGTHRVFGYPFEGYWEDIGTIRSFYEANLALTHPKPPFNFHDPARPVYTHPRFLPGSRIYDVQLDNVLLAEGCVVEGAEIRNTVIGLRSVIGEDVVIRDTVVMGADYYEGEVPGTAPGVPPMGIGRGSRICGAIIDKNVRIGPNVRIECFPRGTELDLEHCSIRDGVVVVPKNTIIPAGTVIGPEP